MSECCTVEAPEARFADELAMVRERMNSPEWKDIDEKEAIMEQLPQQHMPLEHRFTPGLYGRKIFMPKGSLLTSRIHLTDHQFIVLSGVVAVWDGDWVVLTAPHWGITKAGTRRVLYILEDCEWITFHATSETDPDKIVLQITYSGGKYNQLGGAKS